MPESITLTLPSPISANRYWATRVVTPKGGKPMAMTYVTPEARQYKESVAWLLKAAGVRAPITGRVAIDLKLYPHRPLDYKKRIKADPIYWADTVQCLDLDNISKVLLDAMKGIAIDDDKWVHRITSERMEPDGRAACVVVTITPIVLTGPQDTLQLPDPPKPVPEPEVRSRPEAMEDPFA